MVKFRTKIEITGQKQKQKKETLKLIFKPRRKLAMHVKYCLVSKWKMIPKHMFLSLLFSRHSPLEQMSPSQQKSEVYREQSTYCVALPLYNTNKVKHFQKKLCFSLFSWNLQYVVRSMLCLTKPSFLKRFLWHFVGTSPICLMFLEIFLTYPLCLYGRVQWGPFKIRVFH